MSDTSELIGEKPYPGFSPIHMDFRTRPDVIRSDHRFMDRRYAYADERTRVQLWVSFVGEDGFQYVFENLLYEVKSTHDDHYGGITVYEEAAGDYVAIAHEMLDAEHSDVDDAMAIAADPMVAGPALRMWYDRQTGAGGPMVRKKDRYRKKYMRHFFAEQSLEELLRVYDAEVDESESCEAVIRVSDEELPSVANLLRKAGYAFNRSDIDEEREIRVYEEDDGERRIEIPRRTEVNA